MPSWPGWGGGAGGGQSETDEDDINTPSFVSKGLYSPHGQPSAQTYPSARPAQPRQYSGFNGQWAEGRWASNDRRWGQQKASSWWQKLGANLCLLLILAAAAPFALSALRTAKGDGALAFSSLWPASTARAPNAPPPPPRGRARGEQEDASEQRALRRRLETLGLREQRERDLLRRDQTQLRNERAADARLRDASRKEPGGALVEGLKRKVRQLEKQVMGGELKESEGQQHILSTAEHQVQSLESKLRGLQVEEAGRVAAEQREHRRVVALVAKDEALRNEINAEQGDGAEIERLKRRLHVLETDQAERSRARGSGEVERIKRALQARIRMQAAHVQELKNENDLLQSELRDAQKTAVVHRVKLAVHHTKVKAQKQAEHNPPASDSDSEGLEHRRHAHAHNGGWHNGAWKTHKMSYEQEVEAKEKALERKIDRQASAIEDEDRDDDVAGLDSKHKAMLEDLERAQKQRNAAASAGADRDLDRRGKEIDDIMGSNSNCPGPDCMLDKPTVPKDVQQATAWAQSRYASQ